MWNMWQLWQCWTHIGCVYCGARSDTLTWFKFRPVHLASPEIWFELIFMLFVEFHCCYCRRADGNAKFNILTFSRAFHFHFRSQSRTYTAGGCHCMTAKRKIVCVCLCQTNGSARNEYESVAPGPISDSGCMHIIIFKIEWIVCVRKSLSTIPFCSA